MDTIVHLNNQTAGRDKIIRLLQYSARAGWYYSQKNRSTRYSSDILKSLEYTFSSFRKLLRFGRCLDSLYSALAAMRYPDPTIRITAALSRITNALFLLADHAIWLGRVGVTRVDLDKWTSLAHRYWLLTIITNLARDLYEILKIVERNSATRVSSSVVRSKISTTKKLQSFLTLVDHRDVLLDAVKNGCDLFIPLTALGYTKLTPGVIGLLGTVSSAVGLYCLIHPMFKLPAT